VILLAARIGAHHQLEAIGPAVAVGVGPLRVEPQPILATIRQAVAVRIAGRGALRGRQLVPLLPPVRQLVAITIGGDGRCRTGEARQNGSRQHDTPLHKGHLLASSR
jgi:hypothetical protein